MATHAIRDRLAIEGGPPVRTDPIPPRLQIDAREIAAVTALMERCMREGGAFDRYRDSAATAGGPIDRPTEVDTYERELAEYFGVRFGTCVSSGTAAIHAALAALDLEPGTEVICASLTDPGAVMPVLFGQCVPTFAEHDYDTALMSAEGIEAAITPRTGAIIVTQLFGHVCDMDAIRGLASARGIPIIGDVSQAHGSTYGGSRSAPFGDIGAMSLMSGKHMVAGGQGGFVGTDDESIYWAAKRFADRGKPFNQPGSSNSGLGLNYRMTELEAVIGRVQLTKLESIMNSRRQIDDRLRAGVAEMDDLRPVRMLPRTNPNPWRSMFLVDRRRVSTDTRTLASAVTAEGIPSRALTGAVNYRLDYLRDRKTFGRSQLPYGGVFRGRRTEYREPSNPVAERVADDMLLLDIHENWTDRETTDAVAALRKVLTRFRLES